MIREGKMGRKRYQPEQIIGYLREAEVFVSQGQHDWPGLSKDRDYGADVLPVAEGVREFERGSS